MENYEEIIKRGSIRMKDVPSNYGIWVLPISFFFVSLYALYASNTEPALLDSSETEYYQEWSATLFNLFLMVIFAFSIYLLLTAKRFFNLVFVKCTLDDSEKEKIIARLKEDNKWEVQKKEDFHWLFYEHHLVTSSYYITVLYDEKGFYVNSFPFTKKVIDFGSKQKRSEEICESITQYFQKA